EARTLLRRHHPVEQRLRECRRLRQHARDVGIADGEFFGDDAAGEAVRAGAALFLGQRERAQPHLRGLVERLHQQRPRARLHALRLEREWLDHLCDEIADRVADLQLLRTEVKVVHSTSPISCATQRREYYADGKIRSSPRKRGPSFSWIPAFAGMSGVSKDRPGMK